MPNGSTETTRQEILSAAKKARQDLVLASTALEEEQAEIASQAWGRRLTDDELDQLDRIRLDQAAISDTLRQLAFVTLAALDRTDELMRIKNAMETVNNDLERRRQGIEDLVGGAQKFAEILGKITEVATKADDLLNT